MQKTKTKKKKKKGSAMIMAMMVLVSAMIIVVSISVISIAERRMSAKVKSSTPAFQVADSGVEIAMKKIQDSAPADAISDHFTETTSGSKKFTCGINNCDLIFLDEDGNVLAASDMLGDIKTMRAVGTAGAEGDVATRAIETSVAAAGMFVYVTPVCTTLTANGGPYETINYPAGIPSSAAAVIVRFMVYSGSESRGYLMAKADSFSERYVAKMWSLDNSDDSSGDTNTVIMPYESSRSLQARLDWGRLNASRGHGGEVCVDGYVN